MSNELVGPVDDEETPVTRALSKVVSTLEALNASLVARDLEFTRKGEDVLGQMRWANRLFVATIALLGFLGYAAVRLLTRQDTQQDRLAELAAQVERIDERLERVDKTTESTRESVEDAASSIVREPRVELEVRSAPPSLHSASARPQLAVVIRPRKQASATASVSVVIPIEPPSSSKP